MTVRARIDVEEPVSTGAPFRAAVIVDTTSARTTHGVELLLRGFTSLVATSAPEDPRHPTFGAWAAHLADTESFGPGTHRFDGSLLLPEDAPPTGEGAFEVYYQLDARVKLEVPWVPEATATRRIAVVRSARRDRPARSPVTVSSVARRRGALVLELSLDDVSFAPGDTIAGTFSVANLDDEPVHAAVVSLVPRCADVAGGGDVSVLKSLAGVRSGVPVRFALPLSRAAALSFASRTLDVEQAILLRVGGSSAACRIPVVIDNFRVRGPYR